MIPNRSPWLAELNRARDPIPLPEGRRTDVVIVGGGIAGVATAYFVLKHTDKKVVLLETDQVAHGATGHNAGQLLAEFERPYADIVREFGVEKAAEGHRLLDSAWALLEEIRTELNLKTPLYRFTGYVACATLEQLMTHLEKNRLRIEGGLPREEIFVSEESGWGSQASPEHRDLFAVIPHDDLLSLIESNDKQYHAAIAGARGCMNSAAFTDELALRLLETYAERFEIFEKSPVSNVRLMRGLAEVTVGDHRIEAERVVLATNGFEYFTITNEAGTDIDTKFHHMMNGRIGYMAGYLGPLDVPPTTIAYFPKENAMVQDPTGTPYFYLTRRPHTTAGGEFNLICAGGPEKVLPNQADYSRSETCNEAERDLLDEFLSSTYLRYPDPRTDYAFCWHGLMGYTPNGIRRIGIEPCNPVLMYNLGCNGIGLLPSLYGGKRTAQLIAGEELTPSIFDPHDQSCAV